MKNLTIPTSNNPLRLPSVLDCVSAPRAAWLKGVKDGRDPHAIKFGPQTTALRASAITIAIDKLIANLATVK